MKFPTLPHPIRKQVERDRKGRGGCQTEEYSSWTVMRSGFTSSVLWVEAPQGLVNSGEDAELDWSSQIRMFGLFSRSQRVTSAVTEPVFFSILSRPWRCFQMRLKTTSVYISFSQFHKELCGWYCNKANVHPANEKKLQKSAGESAAASMAVNPLEGLRSVAVNHQPVSSTMTELHRQQPCAAGDSAALQGTRQNVRSSLGPSKWVSPV